MKVRLKLREEVYEVKPGMTIRDSLQKLGINPETVLAIREGELLTDDNILKPGETIKLIPVISGG